MKQGLKFLTLVVLFFSSYLFLSPPSLAFSYDAKHLSEKHYWHKLLHVKNGQSEIDSAEFFLAENGKTSPKSELEATVFAVIENKKDIFCRFPARIKWLYQQISSLEEKQPYQKCAELEKLIEEYKPSKAVLVFPTAHINSPASMFGHTFLRLDDDSGLPLTANAINYSANTQETNGFVFAYKGLFGGYEGRYSVLPYYKKIKEYSNLEKRDVWEYELNLTKQEMVRLLTHLYEVKDTFSYYYFYYYNCSYNLLWLLEVARKDTNLVNTFHFQVIPIDSVRAVQNAGFITKAVYRPSKAKKIKALVASEKKLSKEKPSAELKKAYQAEINTQLLQLKRSENKIDKAGYTQQLIKNLNKRSKLPKLPALNIKRPENPLLSHNTSRVSFAMNNEEQILLGFKPSFHDIYDVEKGFVKGAYIDFFDLELIKEKNNAVKIHELNFVNINSYAIRDSIFQPISWGVSVGLQEFREQLHFKLTTEVGITHGITENIFFFVMLKPSFYYLNSSDNNESAVFGIAPKLGVISHSDKYKIGFIVENNYFNTGENLFKAELFSTITVSKNTAVNLKAESYKNEHHQSVNVYSLSLFYYF